MCRHVGDQSSDTAPQPRRAKTLTAELWKPEDPQQWYLQAKECLKAPFLLKSEDQLNFFQDHAITVLKRVRENVVDFSVA